MPTSDVIIFTLGLADYAFVLAFVAVTGFIARKAGRATEKPKVVQAVK